MDHNVVVCSLCGSRDNIRHFSTLSARTMISLLYSCMYLCMYVCIFHEFNFDKQASPSGGTDYTTKLEIVKLFRISKGVEWCIEKNRKKLKERITQIQVQ